MNRKKLWIVLLPLLLLVVAAVLVGFGAVSNNRMVASTPVYNNPTTENSALETIADETTPLAGAKPIQPLDIESVVVRVYAPAQTDSAPEQLPLESEIVPAPAAEEPAPLAPAPEAPVAEEPVAQEPVSEEPADASTSTTRMLDRAYSLIAQFNACTNSAEKRALLGITNSNFSNDSFRKKIISDMGGSFEQLEAEVVDSTQYQQGKTLYVQVYIAGKSTDYEPVVYSTQNSDLSGSQWSTNLVYDDDTATWMEYTKKHTYNDSRVGYSLAGLNGNEGGYDELKDTMETSDLWQPVDETPVEEAPAEAPAPVTEG